MQGAEADKPRALVDNLAMSDAPRKPPTRLEVKPGDSPFMAMARELVERPDSVASLQVMSQINRFAAPRMRAVDQLVEALADEIEQLGSESSRAKVQAATRHWEAACEAQLTPQLLEGFRASAQELIQERGKRPPPLREILKTPTDRRDFGYEVGADLSGLEGTWHRLWALISMERLWSRPEPESAVPQLRAQFEQLLGRPLAAHEWDELVAHAHRHADEVMRPDFGDGIER